MCKFDECIHTCELSESSGSDKLDNLTTDPSSASSCTIKSEYLNWVKSIYGSHVTIMRLRSRQTSSQTSIRQQWRVNCLQSCEIKSKGRPGNEVMKWTHGRNWQTRKNAWTQEPMDAWTHGRMDAWTHGRKNAWAQLPSSQPLSQLFSYIKLEGAWEWGYGNGRGKRVKWVSEETSYHWNTFVSKLQRILNGSWCIRWSLHPLLSDTQQ